MHRGVGVERRSQRFAQRHGQSIFKARRYGYQIDNRLGLIIMMLEKCADRFGFGALQFRDDALRFAG